MRIPAEAIDSTNVRRPQGTVKIASTAGKSDQRRTETAAEYQPLIIHYNNNGGAAVRTGDVASVTDSVQDVRNAGMTNAKPAILLMIRKLPEIMVFRRSRRHRAKTAGTTGQ